MKNDIINTHLNLKEKEELTEKSNVIILDIIVYAKEKLGVELDRVQIFSFQNNYGLISKKINSYKTVSLKNLKNTQEIISDTYKKDLKHNVKQTLTKINKWVRALELYIQDSNKENEKQFNLMSNKSLSLTVYSLIEHEKKNVPFYETYQKYKNVYLVSDEEPGDLKDFLRYLELNYLKIDEESFYKALN